MHVSHHKIGCLIALLSETSKSPRLYLTKCENRHLRNPYRCPWLFSLNALLPKNRHR